VHVLLTGNRGYVGPVVTEALMAAGHSVVGLDSGLFEDCNLEPCADAPTIRRDLRDVSIDDVRGFDAIVHLANLSNDPLGKLDPTLTQAINVEATVRLAQLARAAGVRRFLNSSSCSVYGAATEAWVDEDTIPRPVTAYGETKLLAENALARLGDAGFCVFSLRNATAFGYSPRLRLDLVVNDLVASARLNREVRLTSDGSAWRPLVHIRDIAQAFVRALEVPADRINRRVANVGTDDQNLRIIDLAELVVQETDRARLMRSPGAEADRRSYRVRFGRIRELLPGFDCQMSIRAGVRELVAAYERIRLSSWQPCVRLDHLAELMASGHVDERLRVVEPAAAMP